MTDLIKPTNFDAVADVTLTLCQPEEGDDLKHPSVALKVGYDLTRLAGLKYACCIKKGNDLGKSEAADFLQLLKLQWSTKVSKTAHSIIKERHFDNKRKLPHPKDVQTIAEKLQAAVKDFDFTDSTLYSSVVKTILPRVMVYNRRRSGEIQALTLSRYHARTTKVDDVEESLLGTLSTLEQYLLDQQELIWIRGKRGKRVPVLVPPDCSSALQYLARQDVRKHGGVRPDNQYLFANTGHGVFSAWKCLKDLTEEHTAELIHPDRLCSTGYRAYMATVVQLMGLKDHQLQWICNHLGHTEAIHKTHYRHTLEGVERIQLGKLLLLQDKNLISKFQSKGLEDIQFEDIVTQIDEARSTIENTTSTPANESLEEDCFGDDARETVDLDEVSCDIGEVGTSVKKPVKRVRWTDDEVDEIKRYAAKFLDQGKTPSRQQCASFVKQSIIAKGVLHRRSPDLIMKKISAMNIKARK